MFHFQSYNDVKHFGSRFEKVFDQRTTQDEVFDNVAKGVIDK